MPILTWDWSTGWHFQTPLIDTLDFRNTRAQRFTFFCKNFFRSFPITHIFFLFPLSVMLPKFITAFRWFRINCRNQIIPWLPIYPRLSFAQWKAPKLNSIVVCYRSNWKLTQHMSSSHLRSCGRENAYWLTGAYFIFQVVHYSLPGCPDQKKSH